MAPMRLSTTLSVLSILSLTSSCFATTDQNMTLDDRDARVVLSPLSAWALSNQANGEHGGTFSFSNTENATTVVSFPQNATAVFWQGFKRAGSALYLVCLDCADSSQAQLVDGHDPDLQLINSVTTIFSAVSLDPHCNHKLTITNLVDPRFGSPSQITVDSFIITVLASWSAPPIYPAAAASSAQSMTSIPVGASPTAAAYWSKPSSKSVIPTGAIVGIAFAAAIVLFAAIGVVWWVLRQRKSSGAMYRSVFGMDSEKRGAKIGAPQSPMFNTLRTPPRNAEQASMFGASLRPTYSDLDTFKSPDRQFSDRTPVSSSDSPLTRSTRPLSIRSALSSNISREPSTRSNTAAPSEWGTIPLVLNNPFASPHDADVDTDPDFDFDTPLPSSELGSTFTMNDDRRTVDIVHTPSPSIHKVARQPAGPAVMSTHPMWRRTGGDMDDEQTPTQTRGWLQVEV